MCRPNARMLLKRIPEEIKQTNVNIQKAIAVLQRLWHCDYGPALWSPLLEEPWTEDLAPLVSKLVSVIRNDILQTVFRYYRAIHADTLSKYLHYEVTATISGTRVLLCCMYK